jgi:hypothetical protein
LVDRLDICIDGYVPGERFDPATLPAPVDPRRASHEELAVAWRRQWESGQELRIRFLDGDRRLHRRVEGLARRWLDHANLGFRFGNDPDAELRISFQGTAYRSLVGTDALRSPSPTPTMELGGFTADTDEELLRRTVLHEFGHAIGCVHEQASPAVEIPWDEDKVYAYYRRWEGWDEATTYHNVLRRYSSADTRFTEHDPHSIMQYPVPNELTIGNFEIGWNTDLSETDKSFIARMYPS